MSQRKVILILGKTGKGKSTLCKKIIDKAERTIILDPRFEYEGQVVYTFPEFAEAVEESEDSSFKIVCRFKSELDTNFSLKLMKEMENFLLVCEEAEVYFDARSQNDEMNHFVNFGRHQNISLVGVTQRAPQLNIKFRAQYSSLFCFNQTEPYDLAQLEKYGFDASEISSLPDFEYKFIGEDLDEISFE